MERQPLSTAERQKRYREKNRPKRKAAVIPPEAYAALEAKLQADNKKFQPWMLEQINNYIKGGE